VFVIHLGDIVQDWNSAEEWENASAALSLLDGRVPYSVLPGNHDRPMQGEEYPYNSYFPASMFEGNGSYMGSFPSGSNENSYHFFSASGLDFIVLSLEFCPAPETIEWADSVLKANPGRKAIIATHGFLGKDGRRHVHAPINGCSGKSNTQYIWDSLIYPNPNVFLVLSGHVHNEIARADPNIAGTPVHQLLADYQARPNGGNGFFRLLEFSPSEERIYVSTLSPYLKKDDKQCKKENASNVLEKVL